MNKIKRVKIFFYLFFPILLFGETNLAPQVRELTGQVTRFDEQTGSFVPAEVGYQIVEPTLFFTSENSDILFSFPGKIAARMDANSHAVFAPAKQDIYEVDLRKGTVTALLDPNRDKTKWPRFLIRTLTGTTEATGTFYAVTEYKGQTYSAVKKGKVKKKIVPPPKPNFAAYLKKATSVKLKSKPKPITFPKK